MNACSTSAKRSCAVAVLIFLAVPALTACSGRSEAVYDFTQINGMESKGSIEVRVPESLREAAGADAERLLVTSFTARSHGLDGSDHCAIDLEISYADGALETLTRPWYTQQEAAAAVTEQQQQFLDVYGVSSIAGLEELMVETIREQAEDSIGDRLDLKTVEEYLLERYGTADEKNAAAQLLLELNSTNRVSGQFESAEAKSAATVEQVVEAVYADIEKEQRTQVDEAAKVPDRSRVAGPLGLEQARPEGELDEDRPDEGSYFSDDLKNITVVQDCANSPTDQDATSELGFPVVVDGGVRTFADVKLAVMKGGGLSVVEGGVNGFVLDANGDWIAE